MKTEGLSAAKATRVAAVWQGLSSHPARPQSHQGVQKEKKKKKKEKKSVGGGEASGLRSHADWWAQCTHSELQHGLETWERTGPAPHAQIFFSSSWETSITYLN